MLSRHRLDTLQSSGDGYLQVSTHEIDIASKLEIHSCTVSLFLADLPYDDIPVEIIALISKFYLSKTHTKEAINPYIRERIPRSCNLTNSIPTTRSVPKGCSCRSFLSAPQVLLETVLLGSAIGTAYGLYYGAMDPDQFTWLLIVMSIAAVIELVVWAFYVNKFLDDANRFVVAPISEVDERVLSLNRLFDSKPSIKLYIDGWHTKTTVGRRRRDRVITTFRLTEHLNLHGYETVIEPNIYNEDVLYPAWGYYFDFEILLHFDEERDRVRYRQLVTSFINNNIHDTNQTFCAQINYNIQGLGEWVTGGDNRSYLVILNQHSECLVKVLQWAMRICIILCVSWLVEVPLYCFLQRKQLKIIKYLSIDKLCAAHSSGDVL